MRIEVGKYYRTADGRKIGPMRRVPTEWGYRSSFEWTAGERSINSLWTSDGSDSDWQSRQSGNDLVSEWPDEPTGPVRERTVKEIVPGVYGRLYIAKQASREPRLLINLADECGKYEGVSHGWSIAEIRAAAANLIAIADALETQP